LGGASVTPAPPKYNLNFPGPSAAQILGHGAFDSTNSAQIIELSPGLCAVMGGAGVTDVSKA